MLHDSITPQHIAAAMQAARIADLQPGDIVDPVTDPLLSAYPQAECIYAEVATVQHDGAKSILAFKPMDGGRYTEWGNADCIYLNNTILVQAARFNGASAVAIG